RLADGRTVPAGPVAVTAAGAGVSLAGIGALPSGCELTPQGPAPTFSASVGVANFKAQTLNCSGGIVLARSGGEVLLVERIGLEQYLLAVLPVEMNPNWPLEALKAQAVAARTYAAARYLERLRQPWQLHWHFTVDMAYGGFKQPSTKVAAAVAQTRGDLLLWHNLPFEALFCASSGGRTESALRVKPDLRAPDGSSLATVMGVVEDPSCEGGARGLKLPTHWRWKADLPLAAIGPSLQAWGERARPRIAFGTVESVAIGERSQESGRVASVRIRHRLAKREVTTTMSGQDFRMAVGPAKLRSTWWDRCTMAGAKAEVVVIEGRGFGHGAGLSQISAWRMAGENATAAEILARFYPGATLLKKY
nr:SpoIID/LytB domain-containing protein [Planctomycetota bacterium]